MPITPFPVYTGTVLSRSLSQTDFDTAEEYQSAYLASFPTNVNVLASELDTLEANVIALEASAISAESGATTKAAEAAASALAAYNSELAAQAILTSFDNSYLGAKASAPATDNSGLPLTAGDLYFNTTDGKMYVYDAVLPMWIDLSYIPTLLNSLSDVTLSSPTNGQVFRYNSTSSTWENYTLVKADIGLGNVDNTSDLDKPISTLTAAALADRYTKAETALVVNREITFVSKSGYNSLFMVIGGELYSTSGSYGTSIPSYTTGRGSTNQNPFYGIDKLKKVSIPSASLANPITKVGGGRRTFAYALLQNGDLYTWGENFSGECGLGHNSVVPFPTLAQQNVVDVYDSPTQGEYTTSYGRLFIKKTDGYIYGTGYNLYGALGLGTTASVNTFTQITALGTSVVRFWNLGSQLGCSIAQKSDNTIWIAGWNLAGQLGTGDTTQQNTHVDVTTAWGGAVELIQASGSFSYYSTAAVNTGVVAMLNINGELRTCGYGGLGTLGNGATANISTPYLIPGLTVDDFALFGGVSINALVSGTLYAWGYNATGNLGDGTTTLSSSPLSITTGVLSLWSHDLVQSVYSLRAQSFIEKADGLYVCGYNPHGEGGIGEITSYVTTHTKVKLPDNTSIKYFGHFTATNDTRTMVLVTNENRAYMWGDNSANGISGDNTLDCLVPVQVNLPKD